MKKTILALFAAALLCAPLFGCASQPSNAPRQEPERSSGQTQHPDTPASNGAQGQLSEQQAQEIALSDAGLSAADVSSLSVRPERDDGVPVFDVEFRSETYRFEYEIAAGTGEILSSEMEILTPAVPSGDTAQVSEADAKALLLARVPGATEPELRIRLDMEDGVLVYEGELRHGGREYDFTLDAVTGVLLEWSSELK